MIGFDHHALPAPPSEHAIQEALDRLAEHQVAVVDLQFSDIAGGMKALTIPANLVAETFEHGYRFDGAALAGHRRQVELDLYLAPDPGSLIVLPQSENAPRRAQIFCWVLRRDGQPFPGDPRSTLQAQLKRAAGLGFDYQLGVEMEFYLVSQATDDSATPASTDHAGYFDAGEDARSSARDEIIATLQEMGIRVGGAHHETGPGQQEMALLYAGGIRVADQIISTRQVIRSIANQRGLHATFMAKPYSNSPGSGMHFLQRLKSYPEGQDLLRGDPASSEEITPVARHFIGGQLAHAAGMAAVLNTTVNSYKRLADGHRAPRHATWARVSQASFIRVPSVARDAPADIELRSPDAMTNPYLAIAVALSAGLDGIQQNEDPGPPLDENLVSYDAGELFRLGIPALPRTLEEALDAFATDTVCQDALGAYIADQMLTVKRAEWHDYWRHVSQWEHDRYGDV